MVLSLKLLQGLNSPYIIKYHSFFLDNNANKLYIVMEFMANNDLEKYIKTYMEIEKFISESKDIKIGDFGVFTAKRKKRELNTITRGTSQYMAPEMFTNQGYNSKIDVYAL